MQIFILTLLCRSNSHVALSVKRLWQYLVKQEEVQETFIRNIFTKKRCLNEVGMSFRVCNIFRLIYELSVNLSGWSVCFLEHEWIIGLAMTLYLSLSKSAVFLTKRSAFTVSLKTVTVVGLWLYTDWKLHYSQYLCSY